MFSSVIIRVHTDLIAIIKNNSVHVIGYIFGKDKFQSEIYVYRIRDMGKTVSQYL